MEEIHKPVLLSEVLEVLAPQSGERYMDLTAGYAGHAREILGVTRNYKGATLVDRDEHAIEVLKGKYESEPIRLVHADFCNAVLQEIECGNTYDIILADFGVSSPQLDQADRGFSFAKDGPLDMRMDQRQELSADTVVNHWSEVRLAEILTQFGEEKPGFARMIARVIVQGRPWKSTAQLGAALAKYGRGGPRSGGRAGAGPACHGQERRPGRGRIHPATRTFQAIRMAVNDELGEIERTLPLIPRVLNPGGRVAFITFHSLEDRLVKDFLREATSHGEESELEILTKKPIVAGQSELFINPRARSAKLRAAVKK